MPVKEINQTQEEIQKEEKAIQSKGDKLAESLLSSLDLPLDEVVEVKPKEKPVKTEADKHKDGGKIEAKRLQAPEDVEEELEEEESKEDVKEDEDEEVIPKSKFEKRLNSEIAKRKVMEAELAELKNKKSNEGNTRREKLENLSESELKDLKRQAKSEWKRTDDAERESELDQLLEDIEDVSRNQPQRFQQKQVKAYEAKALEIISENDEIDFERVGSEVKKIASDIYSKYTDLHRLERGQATALEMAFEHWKETQKIFKGKSKEMDLKRQNLKLKQKTSLDSGSVKGGPSQASRSKAYEAAKKGGLTEKTNYFMDHVLDVDKFLPPELR